MYKTKQNYSINPVKSFLIGVMIGVATLIGCRKKPTPTPPTPQPDPTDTIVIPTKEKTFDWDWVADYHISGWTPPFDSIKKYVEDPTYKYIYMNMVNKGANPAYEGLEGSPCSGFPTRHFRRARDSVYSVADKCNGKFRMTGIINVNKVVPDTVASAQGIWERDSADLSALGANIVVPGR